MSKPSTLTTENTAMASGLAYDAEGFRDIGKLQSAASTLCVG
jgi:hypothetical protein